MVCVSSVACVNDMLGSLEQISRGVGITDAISQSVNQLCNLLDSGNYMYFIIFLKQTTKSFVSKLVLNVPLKLINRMGFFVVLFRNDMATTTGHVANFVCRIYFLCWSAIQDVHHCRTYGKMSKTLSSQKLHSLI